MTAIKAPNIDFVFSFSLKKYLTIGSIITGGNAIIVEAIPTFVCEIAIKLNVIPKRDQQLNRLKLTKMLLRLS